VDLALFGKRASGELVPISGMDPHAGEWQHKDFARCPLPQEPLARRYG